MPRNTQGRESTLKRILLLTLCILTVTAGITNVAAAPFFTGTSRLAAFMSPLERTMPTWHQDWYVSMLENAGYKVDVLINEDVSIAFLETGLAKYDVVILRTDYFTGEGLNYFCAGDPATSKTRSTYAHEISSHEVDVQECTGFSLLFLMNNYPAGSLHGFVYVISGASAELASAFIKAGASAFIGYFEDIYGLAWGRLDALSTQVLKYMSRGASVKDALNQLYRYLMSGHGMTATLPPIYWYGDGDFKL
jgi:hypothetical protein